MRHHITIRVATVVATLFVLVWARPALADDETALDRYIAKADPSYDWELARTIKGDGYTGYVLDLTSQSWRSEEEVDRPIWKRTDLRGNLQLVPAGANARPGR